MASAPDAIDVVTMRASAIFDMLAVFIINDIVNLKY